jgi:hypothetical protein
MEQGNLYLIHNFSATRSKITIDATTSASEDLSLSLSLSLSAHFHENISKKKLSWNLFFFISYYLLSKKIVGVKTFSFGHDLISVQMGIRIG